jgi:hypothetical protein
MGHRGLRIVDVIAALLVIGIVVFVSVGPLSDNPPPTRREYAEKADKICTDIEIKQAKLDNTIFKGIPFDESPPPELYVKYVKALIPTYTEQMEKIRKITPPRGQEAKLKRYFAATERVVALLREISTDPKKVPLLTTRAGLFEKADDAARALDLKACAHVED